MIRGAEARDGDTRPLRRLIDGFAFGCYDRTVVNRELHGLFIGFSSIQCRWFSIYSLNDLMIR